MQVLVVLMLVLIASPPPASLPVCGCGAAPDSTPEQLQVAVSDAFASASAVFTAEVIAEEYQAQGGGKGDNPEESKVKVYRLRLERWWKGEGTDELVLQTGELVYPDGSGMIRGCDYHFKVGKKYLVYAAGDMEELQTNVCTRTRPLAGTDEEIEVLTSITIRQVGEE